MLRKISLSAALPVPVACISARDASEKEKPPMTTVPPGEKFFALSRIRRMGSPLAEVGVFVPRSPISCTESTRTIRVLNCEGFPCVTAMSNVQRPPVTRSRAVTSRSVRLSASAENDR